MNLLRKALVPLAVVTVLVLVMSVASAVMIVLFYALMELLLPQ